MRVFKLENIFKKKLGGGGGLYYSDAEIAQFKKAFSLVATAVEEFAKKYNLLIDKYYHGSPQWTLIFTRKIGGIAQIYLNYLQGTEYDFNVGVIWYIDEYETKTRHAKYKEIGRYKFEKDNLQPLILLLENAIQIIKNWKPEDLDQHHGGMTVWSQHWKTKEEFEQANSNKYPILDI